VNKILISQKNFFLSPQKQFPPAGRTHTAVVRLHFTGRKQKNAKHLQFDDTQSESDRGAPDSQLMVYVQGQIPSRGGPTNRLCLDITFK
jgi:hypothetical protein